MPVVDDGHLRLDAWGNFYLAASAAAATLGGLLFVVITLAADRQLSSEYERIRVYLTPTVVYFVSVLLLAVVLTFPTHSRLSATLCCGGVSGVGVVYSPSVLRHARRFRERIDRWHYALLPAAAFGLLVAGTAILHTSDAGTGLTVVAAAMLALLAIGIRNSWAIAVTIVMPRSQSGDKEGGG